MNHDTVIHSFEEALAEARGRLYRGRLWSAGLEGFERGLWCGVLGAGLFAVLMLVGVMKGRGLPGGGMVWLVLMVGGAWVIGLLSVLIPAIMAKPGLVEAAERLDLQSGEHNLVATALNLATKRASDMFSLAAIEAGQEQVIKLQHAAVAQDGYALRGRQVWGRLGLIAILAVLGGVCSYWQDGRFDDSRGGGERVAAADALPQGVWEEFAENREYAETHRETSAAGREGRREKGASEEGELRKDDTQSKGQRGQLSSSGMMQSGQTGRSMSQAGQSAGGASKSDADKKASKKKPKAGKELSKKAERETKPRDNEQDSGSSIRAGMSGRGGMPATQNSWSQRSFASEKDMPEEADDEDVEDEEEANRQRGGVQPHLKDRNQAPSRDLGISADQGDPGTGRGGPTPPKKSRGTASLVLGIPIPDFVRGKLGPGTNKVTFERSDPVPMPGEGVASVDTAARDEAEDAQSQMLLRATEAALVQRYMLELHEGGADAEDTGGDETASSD